MRLYVKYMVSLRCILLVKQELLKLEIPFSTVQLGLIETRNPVSRADFESLKQNLLVSGLELLDDKKTILIERIKNVIIDMVHYSDELPRVNYSEYISQKLGYDYTYLSNVFSEVKGTTIQNYIILHKVERVKELLLYDELNITEISYRLNYASVSHLSNQFKKVTGLSPSYFKKMGYRRKESLEDL